MDVDLKDFQKKLKKINGGKKVVTEASGDAEYNKLLADRKKKLDAVNKVMGETNKNAKEYKQETKDLVAAEEKARNSARGYANTLNGLKQELKDLNAQKGNINLDSEEYAEISEKIYEITSRLKDLEKAQGIFGRNVGNYAGGAKEAFEEMSDGAKSAKEDIDSVGDRWVELKRKIDEGTISRSDIVGKFSVKELNDALSQMKDKMDNAIGEDEYNRLKKYYDQLKVVSDEFKRMRGEVVKADNQLKTQFSTTLNKFRYTWENTTSAIGEMEDKLYTLAAAGKKDTEQFKEIAKEAARLKASIRQVDYEIDSMTESSKGIMKMVSYAEGFTAIAQGVQGIGQLFGMDSENAMKGIQTMTALQGIASALEIVQRQIREQTAFGKAMENMINWFKTLTTWEIFATDKFKEFKDLLMKPLKIPQGIGEALMKDFIEFNNWNNRLVETIKNSKSLFNEYISLVRKITDLGGDVANSSVGGITGLFQELMRLKVDGKIDDGQFAELLEEIKNYRDLVKDLVPNNFKERFTQNFTHAIEMAKESILNLKNKVIEFGQSLTKLSTYTNVAIKALKGLGKALKYVASATIILAAFQILLEIVGWITDIIGQVYNWAKGNDKLVNSLNKVESEINLVNKSLERYMSNLQHLRDTNKVFITDTEMAALKVEKLEKTLINAAKALKDFSNIKGGGESLLDNLTNGDTWFQDGVNTLDEFRKRYEDLQKAVEGGKDITDVRGGNWFQQLWSTKSDAKADLGKMQIALIKDLQNQINNLDLSGGSDELKEFYELLQDPMYASAFANVENLFPEEEWAQVLKARVEQVIDMYEQFDEASKDSVKVRLEEEKRLTQELVNYQTNIAKKVRDNNTEAIEDEYERELQALRNAKRDELDEAQGNLELIVSINKKYNRLEMDMLNKHQEDKKEEIEKSEWDITDILRRIRDNRLSAEDESLDKHLQELENERQDAIEDARKEAEEAAKEGHNLQEVYNELILSINIKYDALIKKEKEQYYKDLLNIYQDYARAMKELELEMNADALDNKSADVDINYNTNVNTSSGSFDFSARYGLLIQEEKKYNQERLKVELDYLEQKKNLDDEYAKLDKETSINDEAVRYADALDELKQFKEEGKATEEEYADLVEKENELHKQHLVQIEQRYNNDLTTINNQYLNDRKSMISQSLSENASLYQEYVNQVNDIMSNVGQDMNVLGIMDYNKTKKHMEDALKAVEEGTQGIDDEMKNLDRKLKSGQITYADYKVAKQQLQDTKDELESQGKDITKMMTELLGEVASQWKGLVDSWVSSISSLLSTMNETQMQLIDNQLTEIEHQLEIQEEAYERAEEAAQAHKDKMDSIEDELADARGSRRQFLIDTLAAQQAAYLEDVAAQEKAEQEKEKLEKKQEALEKKRKEQEKKAKVQQAVINTYTAVSNALAAQPWFLGLALSAVALALGMKNVAAIKSTPIYENGGVIQRSKALTRGCQGIGWTSGG